jgi:hypothetical protein
MTCHSIRQDVCELLFRVNVTQGGVDQPDCEAEIKISVR